VFVIGLTGGIGAGKSVVARNIERLGASVIDADREGHESYAKGTIGWRRITALFGDGMLNEEGEIDRHRLGQLVFRSPQAMAWLNSAIHPIIRDRISTKLKQLEALRCEVAVVDAAVLVQAGWDYLTNEVWLIRATAEQAAQRVADQRGMQIWEVMDRISAQQQMVMEAEAKAGVIIDNVGSVKELAAIVERLWIERNLP
jgi:dephospho-CoA kinase